MYEAVNDFILQYTDVEQDKLFRGYQNRSTLPQVNDYTIYYAQAKNRIGTNVYDYEDTKVISTALFEHTINIDFCGSNREKLEERATHLAILAHSFLGCDFFKNHGVTLNFAEDVQYLPFTDEEQQYIHRYRIVIHLTSWDAVVLPQQTANVINPTIENVDVHHKAI